MAASAPAPSSSDAFHHLGHWGRQTAGGLLAALAVLYVVLWLRDGTPGLLAVAGASAAGAAALAIWTRLRPMA